MDDSTAVGAFWVVVIAGLLVVGLRCRRDTKPLREGDETEFRALDPAGKRVFWGILKVLGMLVVILSCTAFTQRMAMLTSDTGDYGYLVVMLIIDVGFVYWAYRVIWKPITKAN